MLECISYANMLECISYANMLECFSYANMYVDAWCMQQWVLQETMKPYRNQFLVCMLSRLPLLPVQM